MCRPQDQPTLNFLYNNFGDVSRRYRCKKIYDLQFLNEIYICLVNNIEIEIQVTPLLKGEKI